MDQNNPFNKLNTDGMEEAKDVLGGGFGAVDSDVYAGTIKAAFAGKSGSSNAMNMTFVIGINVNGQDREYRETVYVTNKTGTEHFYTKGDKKYPLPGFTQANDICLLSTGHDLAAQNFEEKVIKLYDFDAQGEVPTKVQMAVDLIGKPITVAILKQLEDKTKKNDATGAYEPTGETRETNTIDKVFHTESGRTVSEVVRKLDAGEFKDKWLDKNKGQVRDKTSKAAGKSGTPGQAAAAPGAAKPAQSKSLFG